MLGAPEYRPRASSEDARRVYDEIAALLPDGAVIRDPDLLESFATDESEAGPYLPQLIVRPRDARQVALSVASAMKHGMPVVPRGGGTGRAGGCLAIEGGLVLSMESMNRLLSIDRDRLTATLQPGLTTGAFQEAVEDVGLFYPPDPSSLDSCQLGGNVATNASGPRNPKYGPTRDHIRGLEAVLPGGESIRTGGKTLKGVAGYDLTSLLCGSEGTLGIITEITAKLLPRPRFVETALLLFPGTDIASRAVVSIMSAGHRPRALEMMDHVAVDAVRGKAPFRFPEGDQTALILELDGNEKETLFRELAHIGERAEADLGASLVLVAQNEKERREIWESRRLMSPCLRERWGLKYSEDVAVPLNEIPSLVERAHRRAEGEGLAAALYGHAADGNLHVNILFRDEDSWPAAMRAAAKIFEDAVSLGGTITSEHGVGLLKRNFLPLEQPPCLVDLQRRIKSVFDPEDLLNPGKIFPPARAS